MILDIFIIAYTVLFLLALVSCVYQTYKVMKYAYEHREKNKYLDSLAEGDKEAR